MHKVEGFLQEIASVLQIVKIYTDSHPKSQEAVDKAYEKLDEVLREYTDITIGIVGGEFVFGSEIFFDLSKRLKDLIEDLNGRGIEKITFVYPVSKEDLGIFIKALITKKDDFGEDFREYFERLGLENISISKITISGARTEGMAEGGGAPVSVSVDETLETVSDSFKSILNNEFVDYRSTKTAMKNALMLTLEGHFEFLALTQVKRYDLNTFVHSLNVGVLAMFFSSKLGFKREDVLNIGMGALFHDMGKIAISRKVVQKPGALTDEEFTKIKSHAVMGAEILLRYINSLGMLPAIIAFEHHLRYDLRGYPKLAFSHRPNTASLIVTICDCYDALRQRRSYKRDYPPEMIHEIMFKERGKMFEPFLFDKFFKVLGVFPVGTIVELDDGSVGVVKEVNEEAVFSPKVSLVHPAAKKGTALDLSQDQSLKIKCSLNPLSKGKEYLPHT